jgi:hypothetical protein
MDVTS